MKDYDQWATQGPPEWVDCPCCEGGGYIVDTDEVLVTCPQCEGECEIPQDKYLERLKDIDSWESQGAPDSDEPY